MSLELGAGLDFQDLIADIAAHPGRFADNDLCRADFPAEVATDVDHLRLGRSADAWLTAQGEKPAFDVPVDSAFNRDVAATDQIALEGRAGG